MPKTPQGPPVTPRFVALGDIHLSRFIWTKQQQITGDAFVGFRGFLDHAIRLNVPAVIVGDLFDVAKPDSDLIEFFRREMDRCASQDIQVYCIQGNHDKRHVPWYTAVSPVPVHIGDGEMVDIVGIDCCGFDYALKDEIESRLAELTSRPRKPRILFLHQAVRQALKFEGAWNCDLDWIPEGVELTIIGDIHREMEFTTRTGAKAYYTGASHARDIGQLGAKSCLLVSSDLSCSRLPIPYRHMRQFQVSWGVDIPQVTREILEFANTPPVSPLETVVFISHSPDAAEQVQGIVGEVGKINGVLVVTNETSIASSIDPQVGPELDRDSLPTRPEIMGRVLGQENRFSFQMALDLLEPTQDLPETIRDQRDRFMLARHRIVPDPPRLP